MALDPREHLAGAAIGRLQEVARTALQEPGAVLGAWDVTFIYDRRASIGIRR